MQAITTIHNDRKMGFKLAALFANWYLPDAIWATITLWSAFNLEAVEKVILFLVSLVYAIYRILMLHEDKKTKEIANRKSTWELEQSMKGISVLTPSAVLKHPDLIFELKYFNGLKEIVEDIFSKTKVDRFLILVAFNGNDDLKFATVIYEQHKQTDKIFLSIGASDKYVKFQFDTHYNSMLKRVELTGVEAFEVSKMEECDLRNIYEAEEIKHSRIYHVLSTSMNNGNKALFYSSMATHIDDAFDAKEKIYLKICVDKIKNKTQEFINH